MLTKKVFSFGWVSIKINCKGFFLLSSKKSIYNFVCEVFLVCLSLRFWFLSLSIRFSGWNSWEIQQEFCCHLPLVDADINFAYWQKQMTEEYFENPVQIFDTIMVPFCLYVCISQHSRLDLKKTSLNRPKTITAWKLTQNRSKINKN